jgi:hypothetical protein
MKTEQVAKWLTDQFGSDIQITGSQHERTTPRSFEYIPRTESEFLAVIKDAPTDILQWLGFGKWSSMNELIEENNQKSEKKPVSIPLMNPEDALESFNPDKPASDDKMRIENGSLVFEVGREEKVPTEKLEVDECVWLFPAEWYNIIPDKFIVTGLYGESYPFEKGKTDDDRRFGCLAYGIRRKSYQ